MSDPNACKLETTDLRNTMARMEAALGAIEEMLLWTDAAGRLRWCNDTFSRWLGQPRVLLIGKPVSEVLPLQSMDQKLPDAAHPVTFALTRKQPKEGQYQTLEGTPLLLKATLMPGQGEDAGVIVLIQDMTKEQELEEFRIRGIALSAAVNAIAILDPEGHIQWINKAFTKLTGYTLDEVYGRSLRVLKSGMQDEKYFARMWKTVNAGKPWESTLINRNKSGDFYHEFQSITPVTDDKGSISAFIVFKQDVSHQVESQRALSKSNVELEKRVAERTDEMKRQTQKLLSEVEERRQAEQAMRESESLLQSLLKGLGAAFLIMDQDGLIADCNVITEERFGIRKFDALDRPCREVFAHLDEQTRDVVCASGSDEPGYREAMIRDAANTPVFLAKHLLSTRLGSKPHTAAVFFDITDKKTLERQLSVTQKLESIGELASGIAHEINTPIQYVGDSVRFASEAHQDMQAVITAARRLGQAARKDPQLAELADAFDAACDEADLEFLDEEIPKSFDRALEGVNRVADIVKAMKNFSHPGSGEKKAVDLNDAVATTVTVARNEWKYVSEVETHLAPDLPKVRGLPGDLNQVILNIVVNAAHAIAEKVADSGDMGTITVTTRRDGDRAELIITDTGTGIPQSHIDRVFDPFFTTKEPGKGTGQGLAIAHDVVVNKHGGSIDIRSVPGQGSSFIIHLPLYETKEATQ